MASARPAEPTPGGDGAWHSTCGYADCVEPSRYAADSTCKGCRRIKYCTRECQKADWKRHKPACKRDEAADEAAAREGALVPRPRAGPPPPDPELLLGAATVGRLEHVETLLRFGADVNAVMVDGDGHTPLFNASHEGHAAVVAALLAAPGVAVNATTTDGCTPLYIASQNGHAAVVAALLAAPGVDVNAANAVGATPLYVASKNGHAAVVAALLAAPGVDINAATMEGATPLLVASEEGHTAVVAALLAAPGILVNAAREDGATPLCLAAQIGHEAVVAALLAAPGVHADASNDARWTPLHAATAAGHTRVVSVLLKHPLVNVNARTTRALDDGVPAGATPLRVALFSDHSDVAALLAARGGVL